MVTPANLIIWDSKNGNKLIEIHVQCNNNARRGFAWSNSHLFVVSAVPSTGSRSSAISVPQHGMLFTYSSGHTVTIWDASSPVALAIIHQKEDVRSSCLSKDDQFIAMGGESGTITLKHLSTVLETALLVDSSTPAPALMEWVKSMLTRTSWNDVMAALINLEALRFVLYRAICYHLETFNNMIDAVKCFHQMSDEFGAEISTSNERTRWASDFRQRCLEKLPSFGDAAASAQRPDEAIAHYSAALSLNPALPQAILVMRSQAYISKGLWEAALDDTNQAIKLDPQLPWNHESVLSEWVKVGLTDGSWKNAFSATSSFQVPRLIVYKILCEYLEAVNRIADATECLHEMICELEQDIESEEAKQILTDFLNPRHRLRLNHRAVLDVKARSCKKLEGHGDAAMTDKRYEKAISLYSIALGLGPRSPQDLFVKRSKAHVAKGMWEDAINDANDAITLDPVSLAGHEQKYVALRGTGRYQDALYAFESLLEKMSDSPDADIRERCRQYKNTRKEIRSAVQDAIRELPRVLINTITGCLCDKTQQAAAFESLPIFMELISSTTTHIDHNHVQQEVSKYYRYAMFSHKWEDFEALYEKVIHVAVYDLEVFPTHHKLKTFCETARDAGFDLSEISISHSHRLKALARPQFTAGITRDFPEYPKFSHVSWKLGGAGSKRVPIRLHEPLILARLFIFQLSLKSIPSIKNGWELLLKSQGKNVISTGF
ncbi:hypothetical protein JVU11DRAFT_9613 [Chiua virens]|nr:hypothetical protein JVU11DRAFT_9613 [Chiua virens]